MIMIKNEFESVTTVSLFTIAIYYCSSFKIDSLIRLFPRPLMNIVVKSRRLSRVSELPSMKTAKNKSFFIIFIFYVEYTLRYLIVLAQENHLVIYAPSNHLVILIVF